MLSTLFFAGQDLSDSKVKGCQCWRPEVTKCTTVNLEKKVEYFQEDIEDIANSIIKVMILCRLRPWQARRAKEPIKRSFNHYEEFRYRVDRVPQKRFSKENFLHDLAIEAGMNRMDSQLAYGITKRAFRAYYHGTGEGGKHLLALASQLRHTSECLWLHASKRTAEIFAIYAGLMYGEQKQYEECIECIYKALYDELQTRLIYEDPESRGCTCVPDASQHSVPPKAPYKHWDTASANTNISIRSVKTTELYFNKQVTSQSSLRMEYTMISMEHIMNKLEQTSIKHVTSSKTSEKSNVKRSRKKKKDIKCTCHKMECFAHEVPVITAECSQGPYICRWLPYNEEDETVPYHHVVSPIAVCPPCEDTDVSCDDECICTCQICTCPPAFADDVEEAHGEKLSITGLEDYDSDYCYLAPFRDWSKAEEQEPSLEIEEDSDPCMCEKKRNNYPQLFTYLAPFKDVKYEPEPEPVVEPEKPAIPPPGISMATYRCWNVPAKSGNDKSTSQTNFPYISVLSTTNEPAFKIEVTVKTQHYPKSAGKPPKEAPKASSVTVKKNTITALAANIKAVENEKANEPANKGAAPVRQLAAPQPRPAAPAPAPANTATAAPNAADDDKLTKEDILEMFGLNK
ncbi:uncharacterized protein LOC111593102 [Drosophila hydei]|uniref:Uncharacterized protein LOC111593102 n=1 Tax=Drosophila hydei TaxID=7224 RepID=A0A6J1L6N1_DROHY|nr:uncharacterized protein LOC111593102 [Drosophila hydei]